jgi:hypothetical protein
MDTFHQNKNQRDIREEQRIPLNFFAPLRLCVFAVPAQRMSYIRA